MPSLVMHLCIAKKVKDNFNVKNEKQFMTGSIAPDLSKFVASDRNLSHFTDENEIIQLDKFKLKYQYLMKDDFIFGYYIHLYTDYLWENNFLNKIISKDYIKKLNGEIIENNTENYRKLIYSDFTNLNYLLTDKYDLDLDFFEIPDLKMDEIPVAKLNILFENNKKIYNSTIINKPNCFDINSAQNFIDWCSEYIIKNIKRE